MKRVRIALLVGALSVPMGRLQPARAAEPVSGFGPMAVARQLNEAFVEVARRVTPSVVVIRVTRSSRWADWEGESSPFWDLIPPEYRRRLEEELKRRRREEEQTPRSRRDPPVEGQGSGFIVRKEGYILTNRHVIEGAESIRVVLRDGTEFAAKVRGVDALSDVAVLKIEPGDKVLTAATLGDSDHTQVGEFAIAIGAPYELEYSVTFGHVSAKGRGQLLDDPTMDQDFIQTDAHINPGNSGGPLVNIAGEVIGINTLIRGLRTGIGFAIPSNLARDVADRLIRDGRFVRAYLGVQIRALRDDAALRGRLRAPADGVVVTAIMPDGPAARSNLRASDIITAVERVPVATPQELRNQIRSRPVGQDIALNVHRAGQDLELKVKTEAWPETSCPSAASRSSQPSPAGQEHFGMTVDVLTAALARQFDVQPAEGVIVTAVAPDSVAARRDVRPGDVVTAVNQQAVITPSQLYEALELARNRASIVLNVTRRGASTTVTLHEPPNPENR
ncbi:MAG: trypsin-like peptidase domain-containing protein [Verrucomicrobia bacterium]|nr:trypsin-like peptidase domain-containing protein [Verrucomicrobiota bacterium]